MIKLDTEISLDLERFWRWWTGELEFLIPVSLRNLVTREQKFLVLIKKGEEYGLTYVVGNLKRKLGFFPLGENGRQAIAPLFSEQQELADADLILRLAPEQGLSKVFKLPVAAKENLRKVVAFEMDRQTPFKTDQIYFDVRIVENLPSSKQFKIELILVLRSRLDAILQEISDWGLRPAIVDIAKSDEAEDLSKPSYNLLPESLRLKQLDLPKILNISLSLGLVFLFVVMLTIPIWSNKVYLDQLQQEVTKVGNIAREVRVLKKEVDDQLRELDFLLEKKRFEPVMIETLNELTSLIPDNSWLTNLQYKNRRLQIQGQSASASLLIETIESSRFFNNTSFVSPVTQDRKTNLERFQIATDTVNGRISERNSESEP